MLRLQLSGYQDILKNKTFLAFWSGFTVSAVGDAMSRVALTWFVYEQTQSAQALGILTIAYTAPVLLGGLLAGYLLDRFPRRSVMLVDNLLRAAAFALLPLLSFAGWLEVWHVYIFAGFYGAMMMVSLAGGPSLIPSIVRKDQLNTANAMEVLSFTLSGVVGPALAGFLIIWIGAVNVVIFDAISYLLFAVVLIFLPVRESGSERVEKGVSSNSLFGAFELLKSSAVLLSTTLMFMAANIGIGIISVFLPIFSNRISSGSSELYGLLLGVLALGEVVSASLIGSLKINIPLGARIALAQILSGVILIVLLLGQNIGVAVSVLFLFGFFTAPLTIWAQTLRMQIIPPELRGRTFALLRTLMQGATPLGGALGGFLLPLLGLQVIITLTSLIISLPGVLGLRVKELCLADLQSSPKNEGHNYLPESD